MESPAIVAPIVRAVFAYEILTMKVWASARRPASAALPARVSIGVSNRASYRDDQNVQIPVCPLMSETSLRFVHPMKQGSSAPMLPIASSMEFVSIRQILCLARFRYRQSALHDAIGIINVPSAIAVKWFKIRRGP
jgi:hypothetical protein